MFSETLKKLWKSEFLRWVSEGDPIIFRNFAPCHFTIHQGPVSSVYPEGLDSSLIEIHFHQLANRLNKYK